MSQLFKLKNGTVLLSTEAPGGVYNSVQLKKIAELCSKELAVVKATEDQRLALFVQETEVQYVSQQLRSIGLGFRNYQQGLHQPVACLGELCEEHEQPALVTAMDITKEVAQIGIESSLKIGINGCARCCVPCHTLDISIVGEASGYRISLGGKTSQVPELAAFFAEAVPSQELPGLIRKVVSLYKDLADPGESLHAVLDRCGVKEFIEILAPYSQDASVGQEDPFAAPASEGLELAHDPMETTLSTEDGPGSIGYDEPVNPEAPDELIHQDENSQDEAVHEPEVELSPLGDGEGEIGEIPIHSEHVGHSSIHVAVADDLTLMDHVSVHPEEDDLPTESEDTISLVEESKADPIEMSSEDSPAEMVSEHEHSSELIEDESIGETQANDTDLVEQPLDGNALDPLEEASAESDPGSSDGEYMEVDAEELSGDEPLTLVKQPIREVGTLEHESSDDLIPDESAEPEPELETAGADSHENNENSLESSEMQDDEEASLVAEESHESGSPGLADEESSHSVDELDGEHDTPEMRGGLETELELAREAKLDADEEPSADDEAHEYEAKSEELEGADSLTSDDVAGHGEYPDERDEISEDLPSGNEHEALAEEGDPAIPADEDQAEPEETKSEDSVVASQETEESRPVTPVTSLKPRDSASSKAFRLSGMDFIGQNLHVSFESGASVDLDLGSMSVGQNKKLNFGPQRISVLMQADGYVVEVDGMRMFYPLEALEAVS